MAERKIVRLETSALVVPAEVETDGACLYWSMRKWAESGRTRLAQPSRTMLVRFVALAGAKPETICAFSRKYGVLGFCAQHRLTSSHDLYCDFICGQSAALWADPLDCWWFYYIQ